MTYHLFSRRTPQSKTSGFKWNVDIQVAYVAHQAVSVTSGMYNFLLYSFSHSDVFHHSRKNILRVRNTLEWKWPQTPEKA